MGRDYILFMYPQTLLQDLAPAVCGSWLIMTRECQMLNFKAFC